MKRCQNQSIDPNKQMKAGQGSQAMCAQPLIHNLHATIIVAAKERIVTIDVDKGDIHPPIYPSKPNSLNLCDFINTCFKFKADNFLYVVYNELIFKNYYKF